ncbi:hypothetical protein FAI41_04045 [Acetobacteraceae bacterium]|nr:hypothetical protein FAI41_04045 [Acetobacteraceae bacterium]
MEKALLDPQTALKNFRESEAKKSCHKRFRKRKKKMTDKMQEVSVITQAMEWAYDKAIDGVGMLGTAEEMAEQYLASHRGNRLVAANSLIRWQNSKAGMSGFATGLGGIATLPVAIPADMASILYIQLKMIAAIAHMGGHDIRHDKVRTLAFACLLGKAMQDTLRSAGVQFTQKLASNFINTYISGAMLKKINQAIGFRFVTKAGATGLVNLTKLVPVLGGVVGGGMNAIYNDKIGDAARNTFIGLKEENIFKPEVMPKKENVVSSFLDSFVGNISKKMEENAQNESRQDLKASLPAEIKKPIGIRNAQKQIENKQGGTKQLPYGF